MSPVWKRWYRKNNGGGAAEIYNSTAEGVENRM